jgi:hypothetical protein
MLTLTGTLRAAMTIGGSVNRRTGEQIPARSVVQVEATDARGLVQLYTLTVPDLAPFQQRIGQLVSLPVRAWSSGAPVNFTYQPEASS